MILLRSPRERKRFVRFAIVGALGAVVDFLVFNLFSSLLGVNAVLSSVISFLTAVSSNFLWNRVWTYPDSRSKPVLRQMLEFTVVNVVGLAIRTPLFALLESPLRGLFERLALPVPISAEVLGHNLGLAIAIGVVLFWNFFINRYWTYSDVE